MKKVKKRRGESRGVGGVVVGHAPGILLFRHRLCFYSVAAVYTRGEQMAESEKPEQTLDPTGPTSRFSPLYFILIEKRQLFTPKNQFKIIINKMKTNKKKKSFSFFFYAEFFPQCYLPPTLLF